jgi:hypothetical protein
MRFFGLAIIVVALLCLSLTFVKLKKSAAQNSIAQTLEIPAEKSAPAIKTVATSIKNAKSSGKVFEERNPFQQAAAGENVSAARDEKLRSIVGDGAIFELDKTAAQRILDEKIEFLTLPIPGAKGDTVYLELVKVDIFAPGFSIRTSAPAQANEDGNQNPGIHYRGIVKGDEHSLAAVSIFKNEVMGFYSTETGGNTVLGRLGGKNPTGKHILYAEKDLKIKSNFHCATAKESPSLPVSFFHREEQQQQHNHQTNEIITRCVRIYLEANYDLFLNKGSVSETSAFLTGIFNQSAALFANDGISVSLSEIFVWNSPSPFNGATAVEVMNQFKGIRTSFNGDLAHLITLNRDFGGIGTVGSLCNRSFAYMVSDIDSFFQDLPTYSWSVNVLTHETGHSLGSPHTHACVWNGNNTAIDSCGPTSGYPYEGACSGAPLPSPNGGTIMSYCHLNTGVNFSLGFGPQPRNVVISKINNSSCLADCSANCSVTLSPAESQIFPPASSGGSFNVLTGSGCIWEASVVTPSAPVESHIFSSSYGAREDWFSQTAKAGDFITSFQTPLAASTAPGSFFANDAQITVLDRLDNSGFSPPRTASLYPSTISVSGLNGTTTRVRVYLFGLNHPTPDDLDILLTRQSRSSVLMSDAGGAASLQNAQLIFDQSAQAMPDEGQIVSGTYRPTNFPGNPALELGGQDIFMPSAPSQFSYDVNLEAFNGWTPNTEWRLYILDDQHPHSGNLLRGWAIEITTTVPGGGSWIAFTSATSGSGSGTVSYLIPENRQNALRTGKITIRGREYTIKQAAGNVLLNPTPFDYDGDGKADLSVFRPSTGNWYLSHSSTNAFIAVQFGAAGDLIAPADFDGDGKTDICVFRPSDGGWYRINSSNNTFTPAQFGTNGDLPVPGDFDGDGKADLTVYRPSAGTWFRINSSNNQFVAVQFGAAEDKPLVGDFDGDGKSDLTVFRPSNGTWYRINSASDTFSPAQFGAAGDLPVAADYDGDGKTDLAVYRPSAGDWYIINSSNASFTGIHFGISEDKPAPADFDGDGKADLAVFRPSSGTWYLLRTTAGFTGFQFGANGDIPTPNAFVR